MTIEQLPNGTYRALGPQATFAYGKTAQEAVAILEAYMNHNQIAFGAGDPVPEAIHLFERARLLSLAKALPT